MFVTASSTRHPILSALAGEGQEVWTCVNLAINRPWFFATYSLYLPQGEIRESVLLSSIDQVNQLLGQDRDTMEVQQLMLVSPGYLNGAGHWRMEALSEIWRGRAAGLGDEVWMYHLADGRQYIEGWRTQDELPELTDVACLASFQA